LNIKSNNTYQTGSNYSNNCDRCLIFIEWSCSRNCSYSFRCMSCVRLGCEVCSGLTLCCVMFCCVMLCGVVFCCGFSSFGSWFIKKSKNSNFNILLTTNHNVEILLAGRGKRNVVNRYIALSFLPNRSFQYYPEFRCRFQRISHPLPNINVHIFCLLR